MTNALLYQSNQRWRIGFALGAAALIHLAAVAVANIHRQERIDEVLPPPGDTELTFDPISPTDSSTPPPDPVAPTPTEDATDKSFVDESRTPPPIRQRNRPVAPTTKASTGTPSSLAHTSAKVMALSAPRPEYPYEARRLRITGSGLVVLTIDSASGNVTGAMMEQSTGSSVLDNAAMTGFRRWRFKPGTVSRVRLPITFTVTGAQY